MALRQRLKERVGPPVVGELFFDREAEVEELLRLIRGGQHVLISAMRRIGKTSLMREVQRLLSGERLCVAIDVEGCGEVRDLLVELAAAVEPMEGLFTKVWSAVAGTAKRIEGAGVGPVQVQLRDALVGDWKPKADQLVGSLAAHTKPVVVFIDELAVMIQRMLAAGAHAEVDRLVSWLRQATQRPDERVVFVVAGSIGLEPILRRAGLSGQINTFTPFHLEPWGEETSIACWKALAADRGVVWDEAALARAYALLGCGVPHHVQLFAQKVMRGWREDVDVARVEAVWRTEMLSPRGHAELSHVEERLRIVIPAGSIELAHRVLTAVAVGVSVAEDEDDALREVLFVLEHDSYLARTDGGWVFVSNLVREWWRRFGPAPRGSNR